MCPADVAARPLLVVDAANVVGSVPDGWWRDRHGATVRLRDALSAGLPAGAALPGWARTAEIVLVVEGAARSVADDLSLAGLRVVAASGSGDDTIVELVRSAAGTGAAGAGLPRRCLVVTADRGLRARVVALGAQVAGPRTVRRR